MVNGAVSSKLQIPPAGVTKTTRNIQVGKDNDTKTTVEDIFIYNGQEYSEKDFSLMVNASLMLFVGVLQLAMGFCRLGFITLFFSDPMVNGYVAGAAIHVASSQLPDVFGYKIKKFHGPLTLYYVCYKLELEENVYMKSFSKLYENKCYYCRKNLSKIFLETIRLFET